MKVSVLVRAGQVEMVHTVQPHVQSVGLASAEMRIERSRGRCKVAHANAEAAMIYSGRVNGSMVT